MDGLREDETEIKELKFKADKAELKLEVGRFSKERSHLSGCRECCCRTEWWYGTYLAGCGHSPEAHELVRGGSGLCHRTAREDEGASFHRL